MQAWMDRSREELIALRGRAAGWSYQPGGEPFSEPSALAILALATGPEARGATPDLTTTGRWLAATQQEDGSVGLAEGLPGPDWPTAWALLAWAALGGFESARRRGASYLLRFKGTFWKKAPHDPVGHDTSIPGWPWVEGNHAWVETTAMAMLALRREGYPSHPRVTAGVRLLRNRSLPDGGWNFGNTTIFGRELRPVPGPTGLALLSLAGLTPRDVMVEEALAYLAAVVPRIKAPESLCFSLLGMAAWGARPEKADDWLAAAHERMRPGSSRSLGLAYLLLAAASDGCRAFGVSV